MEGGLLFIVSVLLDKFTEFSSIWISILSQLLILEAIGAKHPIWIGRAHICLI